MSERINRKQVGEIIIRRRELLGMSSYAVAIASGVALSSYYAIEKGQANPQLSTLLAICRAIHISLAEFDHVELIIDGS